MAGSADDRFPAHSRTPLDVNRRGVQVSARPDPPQVTTRVQARGRVIEGDPRAITLGRYLTDGPWPPHDRGRHEAIAAAR